MGCMAIDLIATYTNGQIHRIGGGSPVGYFTSPT